MYTHTPFFLLRVRDAVIFILFIIGLALLFIYGSQAIADASKRKYVEGWNNRPFRTAPLVIEVDKPAIIEARTDIQTRQAIEVEAPPAPATVQGSAHTPANATSSPGKTSTQASANKKATTKGKAGRSTRADIRIRRPSGLSLRQIWQNLSR